MNFENQIKLFFTAIGSFISLVVGGIGLAFTILLGMMVLDYVTGLMVGFAQKKLSSAVGKKGLIKKLYIIILISAVYLIQQLGQLDPNGSIDLSIVGNIGDGIAISFVVMEFISIVENGGKLGVPIPSILKDAIIAIKGTGVKEDDTHVE